MKGGTVSPLFMYSLLAYISPMKKWLVIPVMMLLSASAFAQIDSTQAEIAKAKNDTNKVNLYNTAFNITKNTDPEKAEQYAKQGISLAEKLNFSNGMMVIYKSYGSFLDIKGEYEESEVYYNKGMAIARKENNKYHLGILEQALGVLEYDKGKYTEAHKHLLQSLKYREEIKDIKGIADAYVWLGVIHEKGMKNNSEALKYYTSALKSYKEGGHRDRMGNVYNNIGNIYYTTSKFDSSLFYYNQSLEIKKEVGDTYGLGSSYNNIANVYKDKKDYATSLKYYDTALLYKQQSEDNIGIATHFVNVGLVYYSMGKFNEAEQQTAKGLQLSKQFSLSEITITAYETLAKIAYAKGDYRNAFIYLGEFTERKDSAFSKDVAAQFAEMQTKYETEKKDLELSKKDLELSKKKIQTWILIGSIIALLIIGYLVYNRYRLKKKQELAEELIKQRELRTKAIIEAEEKERVRIARELHDGVGQQISAVKLNMNAFADKIQAGEGNKEQYAAMMDMVDDAVKEVRNVSHAMMPNALIRFGLAKAVREFIDKIAATGMLKVDLQIVGLEERLESSAETVLYRVMQETVNNIIKHAQASTISIQLIKDEESLTMMIEDNGKGFDTKKMSEFGGIGLKNIISRVEYLNGTVDFDSFPGRGTTVVVELSLNRE